MQKYKNLPFNSDLFVIFLLCAISIIMHSWGGLHAQKTSHQNEKITHIKAGCEYNYSPYCFENKEGQAAGFSVELLKAAASEMDLKIDFKTGVWSKLKQNLANKELDALPLVGRTPVREDIYDFTFPYLTMHGTIVVRKDQTNIHSITDLKNKQVAVLEGDNAEEYLKRIDTDLEIIPKANFTQALLELSRGKHDAVVIQKYLALQIIKENNISNLKTVGDPQDLFRQSFCFAVSEGDKELLSLLNEGLSLVIANGTFRRLHKKWFAPLEAFEKLPQRIVIGGDNNFPPYEFLNKNGEPDGYNVDLTRALANQLDITIEIQLGPWAEMREKLKRGEIDALQGMFYSPKRDKTFDMSPAHTVVSYVIVARKNSPLPDNMSELSDKSILVQEGDIMHDKALQMELDDQLISTESQEDALRLLANGKHDCALVTKAIAYYYIDKNNWTNLRINEDPIYSPEYCYAVRSGNTVLLAKISDALSAIK
ncbi:MAG: transporter substrate-binding domain-containing protein, partial [Candidatus Marinimicrobia bacterium]|nr:transporter substrate-binding domain-containing protein [Candidatus Neomarinimicrobiota bacterium]